MKYLERDENDLYCDQTVALQCIFNWLAKVPHGDQLGERWLALGRTSWTWEKLGILTREHLIAQGFCHEAKLWPAELARQMGYKSSAELPASIAENPYYFCFFRSSGEFAEQLLRENVLEGKNSRAIFNVVGRLARWRIFEHELYKITPSTPPIARLTAVSR